MGSVLVEVFKHHRWANLRLIDACAALREEVLAAGGAGTFGSVRDTLAHIVFHEGYYLAAIPEAPPLEPQPAGGTPPSLAELRARAERSGDALLAVAAGAAEDRVLRGTWRGQDYARPLSIFLNQAINHATEHRAQIASILSQQGIEPPVLDAWAYRAETGAGE